MWDVFISHASEDKIAIAKPLAEKLGQLGLKVWFDENTLRLGDSLRRKIDEGLAGSKFGIVILSSSFFAKEWPQRELDGLAAREDGGKKVILPVWHGIGRKEVEQHSPLLAGKLAVSTSEGLDEVARKILEALDIKPPNYPIPEKKDAYTLRFNDYLHPDPVSVKVTVKKCFAGERNFNVEWPAEHDELLRTVKYLMTEAENYYSAKSIWHKSEPDEVMEFIDYAATTIRYVDTIKSNINKRIPLFYDGMKDYWSYAAYLIERSFTNFLTLVSYNIQWKLAYLLRFERLYKEFFPSHLEEWFSEGYTLEKNYARLFEIDEPIYRADVGSISDIRFNKYIWAPKSIILEAYEKRDNTPIGNSFFVKYLIPQVELDLLENAQDIVIPYQETAVIIKIRDEHSNEI